MIDLPKKFGGFARLGLMAAMLGLASSAAEAATVVFWDFRSGEMAEPDWRSRWILETDAAMADGALRVAGPSGHSVGRDQAMVLADVFDSSQEGGDDRDGTPIISHRFAPLACGMLGLRAGTSGTQDQQAEIALMSKGEDLLLIKLRNNTTGTVVSAGKESAFTDRGWFNKARDFEIAWAPQPDGAHAVMVTFYPQGAEPVVLGPLRFLASGAPDQVRLQVGYGSATGKALRVERFFLSSCDN